MQGEDRRAHNAPALSAVRQSADNPFRVMRPTVLPFESLGVGRLP